ncbi:MAG: hypothetical protein ACUVSH_01090, partial [Anaerolineae bacterium]
MTDDPIVQAVDVLLEVLGTFGVPGTSIARRAVQWIEGLRRDGEARRYLQQRLQQAEADFTRQAQQQGLDAVAQWVAMFPQQNRPAFQRALEALLQRWNEADLRRVLEEEFARIPDIGDRKQQAALALYLSCLRRALVADERFRAVVLALTALRTEENLERVLERVEELQRAISGLRGLPPGVVTWPVLSPPTEGGLRAYLLQPKYRLAPYTGRTYREALGDLIRWAQELKNQEGRVGVRVYTAPGGGGKTRLLIEAGEVLRGEGWWAGFLSSPLDAPTAQRLASDPRPTFLILDYVAQRQREAMALLQALIPVATAHLSSDGGLSPREHPLALLFLEREMPDWLAKTLREGEGLDHPHRWEFLNLRGVEREARPLAGLEAGERGDLFRAAVEAFSRWMPAPSAPVSYPPQDLPERPLPLLLLALHAAAGERVPKPKDEEAVLDFTWRRERDAWRRLLRQPLEDQGAAWALDGAVEAVETVLLLATLGRPFPNEEGIAAFLRAHFPPPRSATGQALDWGWLAGQFPRLFPEMKDGPLPPIAPDPLADLVLARALKGRSGLLALALPLAEEIERDADAAAEAAARTFSVLQRLWEREEARGWPEQAISILRERGGAAATMPDEGTRRAFWRALEARLPAPKRTLALRAAVVEIYRAELALTGQ